MTWVVGEWSLLHLNDLIKLMLRRSQCYRMGGHGKGITHSSWYHIGRNWRPLQMFALVLPESMASRDAHLSVIMSNHGALPLSPALSRCSVVSGLDSRRISRPLCVDFSRHFVSEIAVFIFSEEGC